MKRDAWVSEDGRYRYWLSRVWDGSLPTGTFVMLNPSTADAESDDPTIRKCVGFGQRYGWGAIMVVNLYALRATDPRSLSVATVHGQDPVGDENDRILRVYAAEPTAGPVVAAWGARAVTVPGGTRRVANVLGALVGRGTTIYRLGAATKDGHPRHPLYVPYTTTLETHRAP